MTKKKYTVIIDIDFEIDIDFDEMSQKKIEMLGQLKVKEIVNALEKFNVTGYGLFIPDESAQLGNTLVNSFNIEEIKEL